MKMRNLKLGQKLGLGFGAVLLLALIANYTGFNGFLNVADRVNKSDDVYNIKFEVLEMRRHEKDYMLRHDEKYINLVNERIENIIRIAEEARDKHSKQADKDEKNRIIDATRKYGTVFDEYVKSENEKMTKMGVMRASSKIVLASIKTLLERLKTDFGKMTQTDIANGRQDLNYKITTSLGEVEKLFLEVRKGEKDVIIFNEQKYYDKLQNNFKKTIEISEDINNSIVQKEDKVVAKSLIDNLNTYKDNFDNFYKSMQEQLVLNEELVASAHEVIDLSEKAATYQVSRMFSEMSEAKLILVIFSFLAILFGIIIAYTITKGIMKQLGGEPIEIAAIAKKIASGDLTMDIGVYGGRKGAMESIVEMTMKLKEIVSSILSGADNMTSASQQISSSSQQLSQGANEQAASVEEVSSTMEEIVSNIEQNNENASQTQKISSTAYTGIKEVNDRSQQAVEANEKISEKINIINDIAFQTNILALNAAVEAARAGEHGKGFAVVAAEVRKLAENSKNAAGEIVSLSHNSLNITQEAGEKLAQMLPEIEKTNSLVQEISAASNEQTNGAGQVNSAIQQLNSVTQQNASASEELATSAEEMNSQAEQLKQIVEFFKISNGSTGFLRNRPGKKAIVKQREIESEPEFDSF